MEPTLDGDAGRHRRSIRLKNRDYAMPDLYFVTICAHDKCCVFGRIVDAKLTASALGQIVSECWLAILQHFPQVALHEFVVMPNHVHGVVAFRPFVGAQHRCALPHGATNNGVKPGSLGALVRSFKAIVAKRAHRDLGWKGPVWQRNYFERVLRDGKEFSDASRYIAENPRKWEWDRENPQFKDR